MPEITIKMYQSDLEDAIKLYVQKRYDGLYVDDIQWSTLGPQQPGDKSLLSAHIKVITNPPKERLP